MLVLPLLTNWLSAILLAFLDGRKKRVGWLAVVALSLSVGLSIWLAVQVLQQGQMVIVTGGWPRGVGITLRADAVGAAFTVLTNSLLLVTLIYENLGGIDERPFPALILFLATGMNGLFVTGDVFDFYVFFEVSMTASFVLSTYGKGPQELRNAFNFTVVNLIGSAIFLGAVVAIYRVTGTLEMSFVSERIRQADPASVILIASMVFVAFGLKLGLFPFHFWLPTVYRGVRPVIAAILSGVLANIGSYGLLRFGADIFANEVHYAALVLVLLSTFSILYGGTQAIARKDNREVLAYSSISQAGYILLAITIGGPVGIAAAVLYAFMNAINKTLLFLSTGLTGWLVSAAFLIGAFSVTGLPPAPGFFGKASLFRAAIASPSQRIALILLIFIGSSLSFIYMFQAYQHTFWKKTTGVSNKQAESPFIQRIWVMAFACLILAAGLWPHPLIYFTQQAAMAILQKVP